MRGAASAINLLPCYVVALFDAADTAVHESEAYLHSSLLCGTDNFWNFFSAMLGSVKPVE